MKPAVVLFDDPRESGPLDLESALGKRGPFRLVAVLEPEAAGPPAPSPAAARYCFRHAAAKNGAARPSFVASEAPAALLQLGAADFAVVAFVSPATVPLLVALHGDARTRPFLRCGVTLPRLDRDYNLAQTLISEGKLHYHEHSQHVEEMLPKRLKTMLRVQSARQAAGGAA